MIRASLGATALAAVLTTTAPGDVQAQTDALIGQIALFPYNFCPRDWAEAAGQTLPITQNPALFSLLGTTYGGDGTRTFKLPDLRKNVPLAGTRYCIVINGIFPARR